MSGWRYPWAWGGCVGAWCPSRDRFRGSSILTDQSTTHNNGTLTSMDPPNDWIISPGAGGGYALDFDGSNDHLAVTGISLSYPFSLACWYLYKSGGGQYQTTFYLNGTAQKLNLYQSGLPIFFDSSNRWRYWSATTPVSLYSGLWVHAVLVCHAPESSSWVLHLNGRTQDINSTSAGSPGGTLILTQIGGNTANGQYHFGRLDDMRVYNRALSASEIAQLYRIGRGGSYQRKRGTIVKAGAAAPVTRNDNLLLLGVS